MNPTAPTAAPEETPMMEGSAIGLRKIPCMMVPAAASAKPTTAASRMRGSRTCITMSRWSRETRNRKTGWVVTSTAVPVRSTAVGTATALSRTCATTSGGIHTGPTAALTVTTRTSSADSASDHAVVFPGVRTIENPLAVGKYLLFGVGGWDDATIRDTRCRSARARVAGGDAGGRDRGPDQPELFVPGDADRRDRDRSDHRGAPRPRD